MRFFQGLAAEIDAHPWAVVVLWLVVSFMVGVLVGSYGR